ncbi:D,D-heptose 1,7-bisphosphate phosphatase [Bradyrhizobium sp. CCBAU 53340]|uniref:D-glycero-alpha-D-manno-heptose-1,7-bisphosphate 7-phosphatase n=1 Tax=Bradyrhizobium sp. CCBAU 53340 TaxID=1325112 RepID=UPI00188B7572|nr:HAD family hydrolase [Bradyrhizobium sp. CCBAU 53340]QOZ44045.1 D,D-heptose 1,7-bisphosphate phosphatase [Bradyrhizobium sp. CCBAU 53340]
MSNDRESIAIDQARRPAVFFDRDGVLNIDTDYLFEIDKFVWVDGAIEAVKAANDAGYLTFVITNQSGVARGLYEESDIHRLHNWMARELEARGARIDAFEYCPFHPEARIERYRRVSDRRKPQPGMITDLLNRFPVDPRRSFVIGDKPSDIEAAHAAGLRGHVFPGGNLREFILPLLARG